MRSEICAPLRSDGETLGVVDVAATAEAPLTERDLRLTEAIADRLANALVLGREQLALRERARVFAALTDFGRVAAALHTTDELWPSIVKGLQTLIPGDVVSVTTLDRYSGQYIVRAVAGVSSEIIGSVIEPGQGAAGRAIAGRGPVLIPDFRREHLAAAVRPYVAADALAVLAVPLMREGLVLGAILVGRAGGARFTPLEQEIMSLLASQTALAVANTHLLEEVSELAIHDPLTGLYNRRHFDAALDLIVARWRRAQGERPLAAIMLDLDNFGRFNRDNGHQAGDEALRVFAGILRERCRSSDLVARYGGEEFIVILEDTGIDSAVAVAESIRVAFEQRSIAGPMEAQLRSTVSAGCAELDRADPTKESLIRRADVGLFMAKRAGRNQVVAV